MHPKNFIILTLSVTIIFAVTTPGRVQGQEIIEPGIGDPYPLEICLLSDEPLEDDPEIFDYQGQEVRVCCNDCMSRFADEAFLHVDAIKKRLIEQQKPVYPLKKCIVTGKALDGDAVDFVFRNRLFRLSSSDAEVELKKNPSKYFGDLDFAVIEKQKGSYPLKTCVVSDKALGDDAIDHVIANQLVRLADFDQILEFNKNPGKYLYKIRSAAGG